MALAIAGGLLAIALVVRSGEAGRSRAAGSAGVVERANLAYTLEDMNGAKVDLSTFAGKPLVINLWATWCGPCRLEMPQLVGLAERFRDRGLTIIGVSTDDQPDAIRAFAAEYKVTYPMLVGLGQDPFLRSIGYDDTLPASILIKADGTVSERFVGIRTTEDWERKILALF
jgi:thiol-disulfide isomerase/thioredoxin